MRLGGGGRGNFQHARWNDFLNRHFSAELLMWFFCPLETAIIIQKQKIMDLIDWGHRRGGLKRTPDIAGLLCCAWRRRHGQIAPSSCHLLNVKGSLSPWPGVHQ